MIAIGENNEIYINRRQVDLAAVRITMLNACTRKTRKAGQLFRPIKKPKPAFWLKLWTKCALPVSVPFPLRRKKNDRHDGVAFLEFGVFALVTTIALFLTMKVLVTGRDYEIEKELATVGIDFVRVERDEDVNTKDRALKRPSQQQPDEPPPPPKLQPTRAPIWIRRP